MTTGRQTISTYLLGRYALGECTGTAGTVVSHMLESQPVLRNRLEQLEADRDVFAGRFPSFDDLQRTVRSRRTQQGIFDRLAGFLPRVRMAAAGLAAVAAVITVLVLLPGNFNNDLSAKGAAETRMVVKRRNAVHPVSSHREFCATGDTLQLYVISKTPVHYRVLSREPGQVRRQYLPSGDGVDMAGSIDGDVLDGSLIIPQNWPGETLYTVTGAEAFTQTEAWAAVDGVSNDSNLTVTEFILMNR